MVDIEQQRTVNVTETSAVKQGWIDTQNVEALDQSRPVPPKWQYFVLASVVALVSIMFVAFLLVNRVVDERRNATIERLQERLEVETESKRETITVWLDGLAARGNRILQSELVALFAAESELEANEPELKRALAEQKPYMRTVLNDLARAHDLVGVYLLSIDGKILLQDRDAPRLRQLDADALEPGHHKLSDPKIVLRSDGKDILIDIYQSLAGTTTFSSELNQASATLLMTANATTFLHQMLTLPGSWRAGERLSLISPVNDQLMAIGSGRMGLTTSPGPTAVLEGFSILPGQGFRQIVSITDPDWTLIHDVPSSPILASIDEFADTAASLAIAISLAVASAIISIFWHQMAGHHRRIAHQYAQMAERIHRQASVLQGVMSATKDLILLQDADGAILYGNRAFCEALPESVTDPDQKLFLDFLSNLEMKTGMDYATPIELFGQRKWFHIDQQDLLQGDGHENRLTVARDMTELVNRQDRHEQLLEQTINALARAIELVDPYLEGHTARVQCLCGRLAQELGLDEYEAKTLTRAAALSQFGKIFVPKAILTKRGRHSATEEIVMQTHVEHARTVLGSIDFGLPVAETIGQMHERLDGSGYPLGEVAESIGLPARILSVCDVFCARTWPRSYRSGKSQNAVCRILEDQDQRYDMLVVQALRKLIDDQKLNDLRSSTSRSETVALNP